VKIIDFGTAKMFEKNKTEKVVVGSSYYIAPEVLNKKYNEKCDTWSVGVMLYMFLVGRAPFDGDNDDEIIQNIKMGCFNSEHHKLQTASLEVQDLVKQLLEVNVSNRLSAAEALKHPWFVKFDSKRLYKNIEVNRVEMYIDRLMHYQINSKFQQMVLAFIVHNVPDSEETKDILKIFRQFNENDDGKLTKTELFNGLVKYVKTNKLKQYINDLFLILDGAGRGYIEYEEFLRACIDKHNVLSDEHLVYAFNFFDKNNTGRINVEAIKANFIDSTVSEEVFKNIFNEIDINQDGEIDFAEFKAMMLGYTT
jgi:calcium-dependent protein kinase